MNWFTKILSLALFSIHVAHASMGSGSEIDSWWFDVYLDEKPIGYHKVKLLESGSKKKVVTTAGFDVTLFYIPLYSYQHVTQEMWDGGCLKKIDSETDDNGDRYFINGSEDEGIIRIQTQDGVRELGGCVRTFAYWDLEMLREGKLLNTQTGEYQLVSIEKVGNSVINIDGVDVSAYKIKLKTEGSSIDLWYSYDGRWLALESETESGSLIRYLPRRSIHNVAKQVF